MSSRPRRILLLVAAGLVVWFGLVLGVWAFRTLHDTIPGSVPAPTPEEPARRLPATVEVSCGTLFDPRDDVRLPSEPKDFVADREACDLVVGDAQRVLVLDTAVLVLGLAGVVLIRRRLAHTEEPVDALAAA